MKKVLWLIVCLMTMVLSVNAQNSVVNGFTTNEPTETYYDRLLLDPQKSIKENYGVIKNLMSLHKENNYAKYIILVDGHYTNKRGDFYDWIIGMIEVKGKDNERYHTIDEQIINVLTGLYSYSLDERFNVEDSEYHRMEVNEKNIKVESGRIYKHQNGNVTKEYVTRKGLGNTLYCLNSTSQLYKKIYNKVMEETGLKDRDSLNKEKQEKEELRRKEIDEYFRRRERIEESYRDSIRETPIVVAHKPKKRIDDMYGHVKK